MPKDSPCELHEMWPCAICNGDESRLKKQLAHEESIFQGSLPPGVKLAQYPGRCAACSFDFGRGSAIRYSDSAEGWVAMGCCG